MRRVNIFITHTPQKNHEGLQNAHLLLPILVLRLTRIELVEWEKATCVCLQVPLLKAALSDESIKFSKPKGFPSCDLTDPI